MKEGEGKGKMMENGGKKKGRKERGKEERKKLELVQDKSIYTTNMDKLQIQDLLAGLVVNIYHQPLESEVRFQRAADGFWAQQKHNLLSILSIFQKSLFCHVENRL